jgi:hypothetical protein
MSSSGGIDSYEQNRNIGSPEAYRHPPRPRAHADLNARMCRATSGPGDGRGIIQHANGPARPHAQAAYATLPGGPCVLVLCHPVKHLIHPSQLLPRGGGAFLAEIDGNLTNWKREDGLIELHHTTKFRGPGFEPILFKLEKITTTKLKDTKGRLLPTVRAVPVGKVEEKSREDESRSDEDRLLIALLHNANRSWAELARAMKWTMGNRTPLSD